MPTDSFALVPADLPQLAVDPELLTSAAGQLDNLAYAFTDAVNCLPSRNRPFFEDTTRKLHNCFGEKGAKDDVFDRCIHATREATDSCDVIQRSTHRSAYLIRIIAHRYSYVEGLAVEQFTGVRAARDAETKILSQDFKGDMIPKFSPHRPDRDSCTWRPYGDSGPARHARENFNCVADLLEQLNNDIYAVSEQLGGSWHGRSADAAQIHFSHTRTQIAKLANECRSVADGFGQFATKIDNANDNFKQCCAVVALAAGAMVVAGPAMIAAAQAATVAGSAIAFVSFEGFMVLFAFNFSASMLQTALVHIEENDGLGVSFDDTVSDVISAGLTTLTAGPPGTAATQFNIGLQATLNGLSLPTTISSLREIGTQVGQNAMITCDGNAIGSRITGTTPHSLTDAALVAVSGGWYSPHRPDFFSIEARQFDLPLAPNVLEAAMN